MQLSELLDALHEAYDRHGDDLEVKVFDYAWGLREPDLEAVEFDSPVGKVLEL